nr:hypothetical protein [Tanacetum cinerariifolium]
MKMEILLEPTSNKLLVGTLPMLQPRSSEVKFILSSSQSQIKMIHIQGDLTTLKCHIKAHNQESQSMNKQSHYKSKLPSTRSCRTIKNVKKVSGARFWIKMKNEHELSYETLTRVYLGSYEHYKSVGEELELLEPAFELQGSRMVEMGQFRIFLEKIIAAIKGYRGGRHVSGLEDDEEGLYDVLFKLESSLGVLFFPCDVAAKDRRKGNHVQVFIQ